MFSFDLDIDNNKITDFNVTKDTIALDINLGFASDDRTIEALQDRNNLPDGFGSNDSQIKLT
jgi:hypothetical protein